MHLTAPVLLFLLLQPDGNKEGCRLYRNEAVPEPVSPLLKSEQSESSSSGRRGQRGGVLLQARIYLKCIGATCGPF